MRSRKGKTMLLGLLVLLGSFCWVSVGWSATYYVDMNSMGGQCNGGTGSVGSITNPKCTLNEGVNLLSSGDTLIIRGGTYNPGSLGQHGTGTIPSGFSTAAPTIIRAQAGETVWLQGSNAGIALLTESYILFDGIRINKVNDTTSAIFLCCSAHDITFQNGEVFGNNAGDPTGDTFLSVTDVYNIRILNNVFTNPPGYGTYWGGFNSIIDGNIFEGAMSYGLHIFKSAATTVSNNIVRNNIIRNNAINDPRGYGGGMVMGSGSGNQAYNNLVYNNAGIAGIQVDYRCDNCVVYNNTLYDNWGPDVYVGQTSGTTNNVEVRNNIAASTLSNVRFQDSATGTIFSNNLCLSGIPDTFGCSVLGNPQFVNPGAGDFRLQSASAAKDQGTSLASLFNTDVVGVTRPQGPQWDIGAYEFVQGGGVTPNGNPIYLSGGGHGDTPSDGDGSVQSCINAETITTPKLTMAGACACMTVPGKELRIRGGTYLPLNTLTCPVTGGTSWATATTITAYQGETVTIALPVGQTVSMFHQNAATDHYIVANGLTIDAMNRANSNALVFYPGAHHIRYQNTTIKKTVGGFEAVYVNEADNIELVGTTIQEAGTDGIGVDGTVDGLRVETSTFHTIAAHALRVNTTSGSHTNLVMARNRIRDTGTTGTVPAVTIGPGTGALLVNNLLYDNDAGIELLSGANGTQVYHNTIGSTTGVGIQCNSGATGVALTNNIAFTTGGGILNNCGATPTTNLTTNPLFTNVAGDVYTLQAASPAINQGTALPSVTVAFDGVLRPQGPQVDIGAYEQTTTAVPTGMGPLIIHTGNPRYFAKPTGELTFLAGAYDRNFAYTMSDAEAIAYADFWVANGMNLIRVPSNDPTFATVATNPPFDAAYFAKLVERVTLAHTKGLYVQIVMLAHINQAPFTNVTYVENYLRHVVDQLVAFDNVLFEIGEELQTVPFDGGTVGNFMTQLVGVVNAQQAVNGFTGASRRPVGISEFLVACGVGVCPATVAYLKASPADFIQIGRSEVGQNVNATPADVAGVRVSIVDSAHIWPYNLDHTWVWRTFLRGHNPQLLDGNEFIADHSEDDANVNSPLTFDARMRMGDVRTFALRMDLTQAVPTPAASTTGYALANPGVEYLVYQPGSGAFDVTLLAGTYTVEWWNPTTRITTGLGQIQFSGVTTFTPPFAGDAVLYVKAGPPPPVVAPAAAIQALMFF